MNRNFHLKLSTFIRYLLYCVARLGLRLPSSRCKHRRGTSRWNGKNKKLTGKLNLFFLGSDWNQDDTGMLQALGELFDLRCLQKEDGTYGMYECHPDGTRFLGRKANHSAVLTELQKLENEGWKPDIVMGQLLGERIAGKTLSCIKNRFGSYIVNIGMDDKHAYAIGIKEGKWRGTIELAGVVDLHLTAAFDMIRVLQRYGINAKFFPEASCERTFFPDSEAKRNIDVLFIGQEYGLRKKYIDYLRKRSVRVTVFGRGTQNGPIANAQINSAYNHAKLVLGFGYILGAQKWRSLKLRDFDVPMSGSVYLTTKNSELDRLYRTGRDIECFQDPQSLYETVVELLGDEERMARIRASGRIRAINWHTWTGRFRMMENYIRKKIGAGNAKS